MGDVPPALTPQGAADPAAAEISAVKEQPAEDHRPRRPLHAAPAAVLHPQEDHGFAAVLKRHDFRYLWAAQVTSQLADKFLMYTLLLYVYALSNLALIPSLVMIAYTFPSVFLSAPAGVYADRHDKRRLMLVCNIIRAILILVVAVTSHIPGLAGQVWVPIVITALFSSAGQVFAPAEAASIPSLVAREQITSATSLFITTVIVTLVVGVPLATLVSAFLGSEVPFYMATGLFVMAAISISRVRTGLRAEPSAGSLKPHVLRELREGVVILGRSAALRLALMELTLALMIVFTLFALGPAYMTTVLHLQAADTYIVLIPATVGMIGAAGFLGNRGAGVSRAKLLVGAVLTGGVTLLAIGLAPWILRLLRLDPALIPLTVAIALVFGCALGSLLIPAFTVLQEQTTEETRGRIFGTIFTVINASVAVPLLLAGGLADIFSVDKVLGGVGVILILGAAITRVRYWNRLGVLEDHQTVVA